MSFGTICFHSYSLLAVKDGFAPLLELEMDRGQEDEVIDVARVVGVSGSLSNSEGLLVFSVLVELEAFLKVSLVFELLLLMLVFALIYWLRDRRFHDEAACSRFDY